MLRTTGYSRTVLLFSRGCSARLLLIALPWLIGRVAVGAALPRSLAHPRTLVQCSDVTLRAAYLAEEKPGQGSGFYLEIQNNRDPPIKVADPAPLGIDWYAQKGGSWLWRASSGAGGSLVNALAPHGPLFAATLPPGSALIASVRSIAAHSSYSWSVFTSTMPGLRYRPGCEHCSNPGEDHFRAVLATAYLPPEGMDPGLLRCGLRSAPVIMPPLPESHHP